MPRGGSGEAPNPRPLLPPMGEGERWFLAPLPRARGMMGDGSFLANGRPSPPSRTGDDVGAADIRAAQRPGVGDSSPGQPYSDTAMLEGRIQRLASVGSASEKEVVPPR